MSGFDIRTAQDRTEKLKPLRRGQIVRWLGMSAAYLTLIGFPFVILNMPMNVEDFDTHHWIILSTFFIFPPVFVWAGYWFGFRCPFCGRGFGSRALAVPSFCRSCGENLK